MTEIATRGDNLPAPAYNPAADISAEDVSLPRIKPGDPSNKRVKNGEITRACIFTELSSDDPQPEVIAEGKNGVSAPIRFFVLAGPRPSYSWKDETGNFYVRPANHPDLIAQIEKYGDRGGDQKIPRRGFNYVVALPDGDTTLPYKLLLKGASSNAAKQLNLHLIKASASGPADEVLFEARVKQVEKGEYVYCVWEVTRADVPDPDLEDLVAKVKPLAAFAQSIAPNQVFAEADEASVVTDAPGLD